MKCFRIGAGRRWLIVLICILLFILMSYLVYDSYSSYVFNSGEYKADVIDVVSQRIDSLFFDIKDFPQDEGNDMLYLERMRSLDSFVNSVEGEKVKVKNILIEDLLVFMEVNPVYYQLRYIDEMGYEIINIDRNGEGLLFVRSEALQNRVDQDYFYEAMRLDKGEIYISPLNLNVEGGVVENRGTRENPEYVPVIRYAIPIFDEFNRSRGVLMLKVYADYFLEDIRRLNNEEETIFLVDNSGYYLSHPDRSREFGFVFGNNEGIVKDYSDKGLQILSSFDEKVIEDGKYIFTFRYMYPSIGMFEIYQASKKLYGENPEQDYYWVLVSVTDKSFAEKRIENLKVNMIVFVAFSALVIMLIFILLLIVFVADGRFR